MQKVGNFEKVSFEQFASAMKEEFGIGEAKAKMMYDLIDLPVRATAGSAGYESPINFTLAPGSSLKIPTGIRVKIDEGWWLCCAPRSGLGCKYRMQLDNTIGVVDSDYYNSDNEGHIYAKITNDSKENKELVVWMGDRFMQTIFIPYGITYSDAAEGVRNGGWGSTGA